MYEKFFKLKGKPFQLAPDPRFFYASRSHKRAMAYLLYGVKQGEGFIVITGDVGTGKTTLVNNLLRVLEREDVAVAQIVTTQLEADDLLQIVAASFGLPIEGLSKAMVLKNLEAYLKACTKEGRRVLLVVDEAQNLPPRSIEELRMLSNFHAGGKTLLQSFLLGQKEFRVTMRSRGFEQLRQRVTAAYHLSPLDPDETRGYILHRLKTVGWDDDPTFDDDAFEAIFGLTGGIPRRINSFSDRLFLFARLEERHHIDAGAVQAVADDIIDEQGGPDEVEENAAGQGLLDKPYSAGGAGMAAARSEPDDGQGERRLTAVEESVTSLATSMREEMALLRRALLEQKKSRNSD